MLIKYALRNILRNKRRTFLTALSVFFAAMIVGLAQGWINGLFDTFVNDYIKYQTGHVRIVTKEFKRRERFLPVNEVLYNSDEMIASLKKIKHVERVEQRIRFGILLGNNDKTVNVVGMGIDPEKNSFDLRSKIIDGALENNGIYIGKQLAEKINTVVGDEILIASKTSEGGLNGIKLRVNGIYQFGVGSFDERFFFINLKDAKKLLKIHSGTTEIYVFADSKDNSEYVKNEIVNKFSSDLKVETYSEQMGAFYQTFQSGKIFYIFIEILIMFLASFVVINTITMSIFERMREIGTLKAMGMTDSELFRVFSIEGAVIGALGGAPGAIAGYLIIVYLSIDGVNLKQMIGSMDVPIELIIKPSLHFIQPVVAIIISILVPAFSSMIPSRKIKTYYAADALKDN